MRIKTTKQMRLDELIKYVWENDIRNVDFVSNLGTDVYADNNALIVMPETYYQKGETYNVVVEEELTEETEFDALTDIYWDSEYQKIQSMTISDSTISKINMLDTEIFKSLAIFHRDTLIWTKDAGIPEEGVIECS